MKRIRVPDDLVSAVSQVYGWHPDRYPAHTGPFHDGVCVRDILEAALLWLSEHPQVPTDEQLHEFYAGECEAGVSFEFLQRFTDWWQRRCFVQEEPEISATAKRIGEKMMGVTFSAADADYLINEVILASTPGYVPALRKGEQK